MNRKGICWSRVDEWSVGLLCFIDVKFGKFKESVALASLAEGRLQAVLLYVLLELSAIGYFAEIDSAGVFQHRFYVLHNSVEHSSFLVESQQEVDFALGSQFAWIEIVVRLAISRALAWSGRIMKLEPKMMMSNWVSGSSFSRS